MILSRGSEVVNYFENFPSDIKAIGLNLSGGTDSAFIFYCLLKTINDKKYNTKVYPMHGVDVHWPDHKSWEKAQEVYQWVVAKFPLLVEQDQVGPVSVFPFNKTKDVNKITFLEPILVYMKRRYGIIDTIFSDTQGMPHSPRPTDDASSLLHLQRSTPIRYPIAHVNKSFIAYQYKKLGIEELSNITVSCVTNLTPPCKECWWCKERKWAFGTYDGAVD